MDARVGVDEGQVLALLGPGGKRTMPDHTEPALEGPEQRFSDEPVMFRRHAITRMAGPKRFHWRKARSACHRNGQTKARKWSPNDETFLHV